MKWCTGCWWVGCYISYSKMGTGRGRSPPRLLFAVPNVTAHPSLACVPITVLLYSGLLLCGSNVPIKGLITNESMFTLSVQEMSWYVVFDVCWSISASVNFHTLQLIIWQSVIDFEHLEFLCMSVNVTDGFALCWILKFWTSRWQTYQET